MTFLFVRTFKICLSFLFFPLLCYIYKLQIGRWVGLSPPLVRKCIFAGFISGPTCNRQCAIPYRFLDITLFIIFQNVGIQGFWDFYPLQCYYVIISSLCPICVLNFLKKAPSHTNFEIIQFVQFYFKVLLYLGSERRKGHPV